MKVLCLGSINIDYTYSVPHLVTKGETVASASLRKDLGGKGCNQAIAIARAGIDVHLSGKINKQDQWIRDRLTVENVKTDDIETVETTTGQAIIQIDNQGENAIIVHSGANSTFSGHDIDNIIERFNPGDFLVLQNEINNLPYIIDKAHKRSMKIFFTPAPVTPAVFDTDLHKVDYLFLNEKEGYALTKETSPGNIIAKLKTLYPGTHHILTLGASGVMYAFKDEFIAVDAVKVNAIDTVAAGDTFTGYFVASVYRNNPAFEALTIATKAAAVCVTRKGATSSIPFITELG